MDYQASGPCPTRKNGDQPGTTRAVSNAISQQKLDGLATDVRAALELLAADRRSPTGIDIGLKKVAEALSRSVPIDRAGKNLDEVLRGLGVAYQEAIDSPVIDDSYSSTDEVDIHYPDKSDIFVPQAFRAIRYRRQSDYLENEQLWLDQPIRENLGEYLLAHLASPYSTELPLVILGQPGSGKSLLTEILAARLASPEYCPVRVVLRDINPESEIQAQIEEQIYHDTGRLANWAELVASCEGRPPLVILDGYDELLQARGKVFSTYLMNVAAFQRRERIQGRPVRIIVTSRITLIDKAEIPVGSTVMRLEEFDSARQDKWISIWNSSNQAYFDSFGIRPFALPTEDNVLAIAQQPLLLLMLALYDSEANRLAEHSALDLTLLYHSLLKRFITRERRKGEEGAEFRALPPGDRNKIVAEDLRRLGIAAIGMFNRRSLHIKKTELDHDLDYFQATREVKSTSGALLGQAELLFGSFFFVHESRSRLRADPGSTETGPAAFEFLHNTFGEFLAAHWLMDVVLEETETVRALSQNPSLTSVLQQRLHNKDGLPDKWFAALMATPLFSRPVVLRMLNEWSRHRLNDIDRDVDEFSASLEEILYHQTKRVLSDSALPDMLLGASETPFPRGAVLTNLATYTLNMVLLRCVIGGPFNVDLNRLASEAFPKPWPNLVDLWRSGLGQEGLMGVSAILRADFNTETELCLAAKETYATPSTNDQISNLFELASAVGDDQLSALAGWALQDSAPMSPPSLEHLANLPAIAESALREEMLARAEIRSRSVGDTPGTTPLGFMRGITTSALSLQSYHSLPRRTGLPIDFLITGNPELSLAVWRETPWRITDTVRGGPEAADPANPEACRYLVLHRALLAADMIAWDRDTHFRLDPNRELLLGGQEARGLANRIAEVAADMVHVDGQKVPAVVLYELVASSHADADWIDRTSVSLLGPDADLWAIATRPRSTILRLLEISTLRQNYDWVAKAMTAFSYASADNGPLLVHAFGIPNTLTLLRYGSRTEPSAYIGLRGIVQWALVCAKSSDRRLVAEEAAQLVDRATDEWLATLGLARDELDGFLRAARDELGGDLSSNALASMRRLPRRP